MKVRVLLFVLKERLKNPKFILALIILALILFGYPVLATDDDPTLPGTPDPDPDPGP